MGLVPQFINVKNLVALVHSLLDCWCALSALQGSLVAHTIACIRFAYPSKTQDKVAPGNGQIKSVMSVSNETNIKVYIREH